MCSCFVGIRCTWETCETPEELPRWLESYYGPEVILDQFSLTGQVCTSDQLDGLQYKSSKT
jgi:hypothetical protein